VRLENFACVLASQGYADREALTKLINSWLDIFRETTPSAVVADFAPGAMLAARVAALPQAAVALGYEMPPPTRPLPPIQPWQPSSSERMAGVETSLLETVNDVLIRFSATPLRALGELFAGKWTVLSTFPELDHYGHRPGANYVGPIYSAPPDSIEVHWPQTHRPRLLAYLRPITGGLRAVLAAMSALGTTIACVPGLRGQSQIANDACQVHSRALRLEHLLPEATLLVTNGNLTTTTRALLQGVPVLALPNFMEQHLAAWRVASLGAALIADKTRSEPAISKTLRELMRPTYRNSAQRFARQYLNENLGRAVDRAANLLEAAAR
jgi:UDP:flavonoid glycosyltransferase YjiC (YdhE family)